MASTPKYSRLPVPATGGGVEEGEGLEAVVAAGGREGGVMEVAGTAVAAVGGREGGVMEVAGTAVAAAGGREGGVMEAAGTVVVGGRSGSTWGSPEIQHIFLQ